MKAIDLRQLTDEELRQRHDETRKELLNLRIQQSTGRIEKATRIREVRRDLARILTIMREREQASR